MKEFTAKEIAEQFKVEKRVARGWIQRGIFPNAYKKTLPILGEVWYVPASDLVGFEKPTAGRPKLTKQRSEPLQKVA